MSTLSPIHFTSLYLKYMTDCKKNKNDRIILFTFLIFVFFHPECWQIMTVIFAFHILFTNKGSVTGQYLLCCSAYWVFLVVLVKSLNSFCTFTLSSGNFAMISLTLFSASVVCWLALSAIRAASRALCPTLPVIQIHDVLWFVIRQC